jgi:hypothetical protein
MKVNEPNVLDDMEITEFSMVDVPANKRARPVMAKRDEAEITAAAAYEALQGMADLMVNKFEKSHGPGKMTKEMAFSKLFAESRDPRIRELAQIALGHTVSTTPLVKADGQPYPVDAGGAYELLMSKAADMHAANPSKSTEQHFATIFEARDPALRRLAKLAKMGAPVDDDDEPRDEPDGDPDIDDDDNGPMLGGVQSDATAGGKNRGRSRGSYEGSGVPTMTNARMASVGAVERSYNDKARPSSAKPPAITDNKSRRFIGDDPRTTTQKSYDKRYSKLLAVHPRATAQELASFAISPKSLRQQVLKSFCTTTQQKKRRKARAAS